MPAPILATKLYIPPPRPKVVLRPRLIERLNEGLSASCKLTLISAPAGFGKTTLVSEWVAGCERPVAWLSLDEGDNDPTRFLTYLIAALQTIAANIGEGVLGVLQSPQPPPIESILTALLNEITTIPDNFILVLDDYHVIDSKPVDEALTFLLEHLPPQMHLVIATREDPHLPLARLRARGQLTELRAADLRFTPAEAAEFLNQVMGLNLSAEDIAALETRTEGWIAGLQLAALSMQGHQDAASFIQSFTGSHHFVLDYLVEEVLQQQSESVQTFLLRTSILDRLCGPLCDAVLLAPSASGQETLEYLERANLFIVPLDNERRWYRYHHLFAELLRQRLHQSDASPTEEGGSVAELHIRASQWYEDNGLEIEAFQHAAAANDIERAERLIEGKGMPLHFRGAVVPILNWLESLPTTVLDARPSLWVMYASVDFDNRPNDRRRTESYKRLKRALQGAELDDKTRDLIGHIACHTGHVGCHSASGRNHHCPVAPRPGVSAPRQPARSRCHYLEAGICLSSPGRPCRGQPGLYRSHIHQPERSGIPSSPYWLQSAWAAYRNQKTSSLWRPRPTGAPCNWLAISRCRLPAKRILAWPAYSTNGTTWMPPNSTGNRASNWRGRYEHTIDRFVVCEVFLARLKLARGDVAGAAAMLAEADQSARQHNFVHRMPEIAAAQVLDPASPGQSGAAAHLAQTV